MKSALILLTLLSLPALAFAKVGKLDCTSPSATINILEEFSNNGGYKVIIAKVTVLGVSRSGFDVLFPNQKQMPPTLYTAALPGYTVALVLPPRTELAFTNGDEPIAGQLIINGGTPEAITCVANHQ